MYKRQLRSPATIRRAALDRALSAGPIPHLECVERRRSDVDPFVKYAFRTAEGGLIEAVRIPLEKAGRYSVCVSSQVGCALACSFCATGKMGLSRNLEAWEIVDQVRTVRAELERAPKPRTSWGDALASALHDDASASAAAAARRPALHVTVLGIALSSPSTAMVARASWPCEPTRPLLVKRVGVVTRLPR